MTPLATSPATADSHLRNAVLERINERRIERGHHPLREDTVFRRAAQSHALDMARNSYFANDSQAGTSPIQRIQSISDTFLGKVNQGIFQLSFQNQEQFLNQLEQQWKSAGGAYDYLFEDTTAVIGIGTSTIRNGDGRNVVIKAGLRITDHETYRQRIRTAVRNHVNRFRTKHDLNPLHGNSIFLKAAERHAQDMVERDFFAHVNPDGETPYDRINNVRGNYVRRILENLAYHTPRRVESFARVTVRGWANSPGHRKNMMTEGVKVGGIGVSFDYEKNIVYVVHKFGNRLNPEEP